MPITQNTTTTGEVKFYNEETDGELSDLYGTRKQLYIDFYHLGSNRSVTFKAFITDWSDSFTSNWNEEAVYGRNDPIATFQGTQRKISLSWACPSHSVTEAIENVERIKQLTKFLYPVYQIDPAIGKLSGDSDAMYGVLAKAPLIKLRFANMIMDSNNQAGGISRAVDGGVVVAMGGLDINADLDAGFWDSTAQQNNGRTSPASNSVRDFSGAAPTITGHGTGMVLAKVWTLSANFTVLHQHQLGWQSNGTDAACWLGPEGFPYGVGSNSESNIEAKDCAVQHATFNAPQGIVEEAGDETSQESEQAPITDAQYAEQSAAVAASLTVVSLF